MVHEEETGPVGLRVLAAVSPDRWTPTASVASAARVTPAAALATLRLAEVAGLVEGRSGRFGYVWRQVRQPGREER